MNNDYINIMLYDQYDHHDLEVKMLKLKEFIGSDEYKAMTTMEQYMLTLQISAMSTYFAIMSMQLSWYAIKNGETDR